MGIGSSHQPLYLITTKTSTFIPCRKLQKRFSSKSSHVSIPKKSVWIGTGFPTSGIFLLSSPETWCLKGAEDDEFPGNFCGRFKRPIFSGFHMWVFFLGFYGLYFLEISHPHRRQPPNDCWMNQLWPSVWRAHLQEGSLLRKWRQGDLGAQKGWEFFPWKMLGGLSQVS